MPISREEYNQGQERVHKRIDKISDSTTRIETYAKAMKESVDRIHEAVYGNGRDGLIQKVAKMFERSGLHTKFIFFIIIAILGVACYIIKTNMGV